MSIEISVLDIALFILVFCRMAGMILFNPLLASQNVPARLKSGFVLGLTFLIAPTLNWDGLPLDTGTALVFAMFRELFIGFVCGMVFQFFYYILFFVGDVMDVGFGLSMAKVFDPATNIQTSTASRLLQIVFVLYLFATNSHLVLIRIFASSYMIIPVGAQSLNLEIGRFMLELFVSIFSLAIRLALPFMAAEFTLEISMGVLMKLIPQINAFVINLQFQVLLGLALLFLFCGPIANFVDSYLGQMLQSIERALYAMG